MNPEIQVLSFLRNAARELRKTSSAAVARVALAHEERLSRQIEKIQQAAAEAAVQEPVLEATAA